MREIAIIGKGPGWDLAPLKGESWGVNDICVRRSVDIAFNMHDLVECKDIPLVKETIECVNKYAIPMISLRHYSHIPTSIPFPFEEMHTDYFTNSISFMLAYAVLKEVSKIDMYGCVMATPREYGSQKANAEYWIGVAIGKGIELNIHGKSTLIKAQDGLVYGYNIKQRRQWHENTI